MTQKKYPFPVRIFLTYLLGGIGGILILNILARIIYSPEDSFFRRVIDLIIILFVFGVVVGLVISLCGSDKKKIYKGTALHLFATSMAVLSPIAFIGRLWVWHVSSEPGFTIFEFVSLILQFSVFPTLKYYLCKEVRRCPRCGLINTLRRTGKDVTTKDERKFHNEGGHYIDVDAKTTGNAWARSVDGESFDININTKMRQYVPKTVVTDGVYRTTHTSTFYRCCVCKREVEDYDVSIARVGD